MTHKIYPYRAKLPFYFELEFHKTRDSFCASAVKFTSQDPSNQGALFYFKWNDEKVGSLLFFDSADKQIVNQSSIAALHFAKFFQLEVNPAIKNIDRDTEFKYLTDCVPSYSAILFEQIVEARNKEFFVPQ
jgi:hypothetical protein